MSARDLLLKLGDRKVSVWADGGNLRFKGPRGAVTPDLRETLRKQKSSLLKLLGRADGILDLSLRQFEGAHCSLEVQLPDVPGTIWFVSGAAEAEMLRTEGVRRGRIWTASELRDLLGAPGMTHQDAIAIAKAKAAFNGTVDGVRPDTPPEPPTPPVAPPRHEPVQGLLGLDAPARPEFD